jgi:hypothetical protein
VNAFNVAVSIVLALAALATAWFAWRAAASSAQATRLARDTVQAEERTVTALQAIRVADERDRRLRQLHVVVTSVNRLYQALVNAGDATVDELQRAQHDLWIGLAGLGLRLPVCSAVANVPLMDWEPEAVAHLRSMLGDARREVDAAVADFESPSASGAE